MQPNLPPNQFQVHPHLQQHLLPNHVQDQENKDEFSIVQRTLVIIVAKD